MQIISVRVMKITDERETETNKDRNEQGFKSNLELALSIILKQNYTRQCMWWWSVDV